jgi:hypothetical protein
MIKEIPISLTISANTAQKTGGGIYNDGFDGTVRLEIDSSTLDGNSAAAGGAIFNDADHQGGTWLDIGNSTISGNSAGHGGALASDSHDARFVSANISNCTFGDNSASKAGSSIYNVGQNSQHTVHFTLVNTILKSGPQGKNIFCNLDAIRSLGYNLSNDNGGGFLTSPGDRINTDPMLGALQDNGGPTFTHALLPGSPAIDAGNPTFTPPPMYDQRGTGFDRVVNGRLDIGSFEVQTPARPSNVRPSLISRSRPTPLSRATLP